MSLDVKLELARINSGTIAKFISMGGFHRAGTGKNKKVTEISPLLAFWPERAKE